MIFFRFGNGHRCELALRVISTWLQQDERSQRRRRWPVGFPLPRRLRTNTDQIDVRQVVTTATPHSLAASLSATRQTEKPGHAKNACHAGVFFKATEVSQPARETPALSLRGLPAAQSEVESAAGAGE